MWLFIIILAVLSACFASASAQFNVSSLDGTTTVSVDRTTGYITHIYAPSQSSGAMIDSAVTGRTVFGDCSDVPSTLYVVSTPHGVEAHRQLGCTASNGSIAYLIQVVDTYIAAPYSVQWNTSLNIIQGAVG